MQASFIKGPINAVAPAIDFQAVSTSTTCPDFSRLRPLGMVRGVTVRSRNLAADIGAGLKTIAGGEIKTMTTLCERARQEAFQRMMEHAAERGATGVVGARYDSNSIAQGITEVVAYGMAVSDGGVPAVSSGGGGELGLAESWISTANELPGHTIQRSLGVVQGLTVRTRNVGAKIGAGFKSLVGGEIKTYTKMCEDARQQAFERMVAEAVERGADGIVAMRYDTNEVAEGITEVLAFGTAVTSAAQPPAQPAAAEEADRYFCSSSAPRSPEGGGPHAAQGASGLPATMMTTASVLPELPVPQMLGIVRGISVRSSSLPRNIGASLKSLVGGEIKTWTELCSKSRAKAFRLMAEQARQRGAKGIVAVRYDCNQLVDGIVEVIAYGTAVSDEAPRTGLAAPVASEVPQSCVTTDLHLPGGAGQIVLGTVRGISVRSTNLIRSIGAGLKSLVGGEIKNYTRMCEQAREEAFGRMLQHAAELGATGVTAMRFESNDPEKGVIEVVAYGTAVSDGSRPMAAAAPPECVALTAAATSTTNEMPGLGLERSLGVVRGVTVRSRNLIASIGAGLKAAFVGGEIRTWTNLCESTRQQALERLLQEAAEQGARGVVGLRYETNEISPGLVEVLAYGTAMA